MGRAFEVRKAAMAKTSLNKAKLYSKYGKEIYLAAKSGIPDIEINVNLRRIVEKARKEQVPSDVIKRAIDKAKTGVGENYQELVYEGFGPGESLLVISCLTDNVNRTISDIRAAFNKSKAKLGSSGTVLFQFSHNSIFTFSNTNEEEVLLTLLEKGIEVEKSESDEQYVTVHCSPKDYQAVLDVVASDLKNVKLEEDIIAYVANELVEITLEEKEVFDRLLSNLEQIDDVQDVYHNLRN